MTCTAGSWNPWNPETHHVPKLLDRLGLRIITDHVEHLEIERVGFRQLMSSIVPQSWQRPERQATHRCTHVVISPTMATCSFVVFHCTFCMITSNISGVWRCMLVLRDTAFVRCQSVQVPGRCDNCWCSNCHRRDRGSATWFCFRSRSAQHFWPWGLFPRSRRSKNVKKQWKLKAYCLIGWQWNNEVNQKTH